MIQADDFAHKGLKKFWVSGGTDCSDTAGVSATPLRAILAHLDSAMCYNDLFEGLGVSKKTEPLKGMANRFSMRANGNVRVTFTYTARNGVTRIDLEDLHRSSGAKKR